MQSKVDSATRVLQNAITDYGPDSLVLSFNGGKDCTVLLHMLSLLVPSISCIYIQHSDPFVEILDFVEYCTKFYNVTV